MTSKYLGIVCMIVVAFLVGPGMAAEPELDPLLELLVEQGVITPEQAAAVQAEYDRRDMQEDPVQETEVAAAPSAVEEETSWFDRVDFTGDVRMRYEGFSKNGSFDDGRRDRFRIRLRPGVVVQITDALKVGIELRNGDPDDPVSNNTTYDGAFSFKDFNLAQGYVDFRVGDRFDMIAGKFDAKKRWTVSDFQWDDDVTVEGLMQNFALAAGDGGFKSLGLTTYQFLLEENSTDGDSYVFGAQLRSDFRLDRRHSLAFGAGFDYWDNPQHIVDLTLSGKLGGNRVTNLLDENGLLVSEFEILNLFAEWKFKLSDRWPLKLNVFYYQNFGAAGAAEDQDTGYFGRVQLGDYKKKGQVAVRYSRYDADPDALFYVFTQSDTSRASDVKAHRFDLRIGFVADSYFNITWYNTKPSYQEDETLNRWQMDYIIRF